MENSIEKFNETAMEPMRSLAQVMKAKRELEASEKAFKEELLARMEEYGVKSVDNEYVKITYVPASASTSLDLKALELEEPELYADLLADYTKTTKRKASIRITVR